MIPKIKNFASFSVPLRLRAKYFLPPRALNDYATHIPILIGLAGMGEIRSVLEFGCGRYSTPTFLNRSAFPRLERLTSVENDVSWAEVTNDPRWTLKLVEGEISDSVSGLDLEQFDLILIDDSKTSAQRAATIRAVARRQPQHPWIVIHDYEIDEYRNAATTFKHRYTFKSYNPQTAVVSNSRINVSKLLDRQIKQNSTLEPDDVDGWLHASFKNSV